MVTQNETRALKTAPPVIGGLVGLAIGMWTATHQGEAYITPLLAGTGALAILCDRIASVIGRHIIDWNEEKRAKRSEAKLTAAIAQAEQDKIAANNPVHKENLDNKIHQLVNLRLDVMASLNPPMSSQVEGNSIAKPKPKPKPTKIESDT